MAASSDPTDTAPPGGQDHITATAATAAPEYDHGEGRMPEEVRTADCHTFATGQAYPDICLAADCPARDYL